MSKVKDFLFKYKIIIGIIVFLLLSFGIYLFVSADEFANKVEVKTSRVTITDGTSNADGNFDSNDEPGNDSSGTNNIVRNFDSIKYSVFYTLGYKEGNTGDLQLNRKVLIDFLLPTSVNAEVSEGNSTTPIVQKDKKTVTINEIDYNYYIFETAADLTNQEKLFNISVININMKNGEIITPIIRVRESTDSNLVDFTNNSDTTKVINNIPSITVSAKVNYAVKLYSGNTIKNENNTKLPVGILIYLPNDSNKGIKGVEVPTNANFNISIVKNPDNASVLGTASVDNYNSSNYIFNTEFPNSYEKDTNGNETNGTSNVNFSDGIYALSYTDLKYHDGVINLGTEENKQNVHYISSKVLVIDTVRNDGNRDSIEYQIKTDNDSTTIIDSVTPIVGDYLSKVDFKADTTSNSDDPGKSAYNYGEDFYIENTMNYGYNTGDALTNGFTNYLKVDSDAIKLLLADFGDYLVRTTGQSVNLTNDDYNVSFGVGSWNSSDFEIIPNDGNRKTNCPSDLSKLTKEDLMNYYGGPCIKEKTGTISWFDSITSADAASTSGKGIIMVKLTVSKKIEAGTSVILDIKSKIKSENTNVIGNVYQVVARGETQVVDESTNNNKIFYMSESDTDGIPPVNVSEKEQDLSYTKSVYQDNIILDSPNGKYGNSIYVTSARASTSITITDKNDVSKTEVSAGVNDPIKIVVHPAITLPNISATSIENAIVSISLPNTLVLDVQNGDTVCEIIQSGTGNGVSMTQYICKYTKDDIYSEKNSIPGTIPNIVVHAYVSVDVDSEIDTIITADITGNIKIGEESFDINNTTKDAKKIRLYNSQIIGMNGVVSPNLINKNEGYTYNMKAKNIYKDDLNLSLLNILPYKGDGLAGKDGSDFTGTLSYALSSALPQGYTTYYTTSDPKLILADELNGTGTVNWVKWDDVTKAITDMTAFKIDSNKINPGSYFGSENGITLNVQTKNNKESDVYYNNFYMIDKKDSKNVIYSSNVSEVSVYNRSISGFAFEDSDYDGLSTDESVFKDIVVTLYKTNANVENYKKPLDIISDSDEKISSTVTDKNGKYKFSGLSAGNYYVKFGFDCEKYTTTEKNKENASLGDLSDIDSDAEMISGVCNPNTENAVSNIVKIDDINFKEENLDLGLRIRQSFDIQVNKYITNVKVTSTKGTDSYDYDYKKQVKLDFRNLKNTSFKVTYVIEIENTKYFPGTVGNIIETIPDGMTFDSSLAENSGWYENNGYLYYSDLSSTLLMPGEKYRIPIVLDLVTDSGGYYVNFVAVNDLKIQSLVDDFTEAPDDSSMTETQPTEEEMGGE